MKKIAVTTSSRAEYITGTDLKVAGGLTSYAWL